MQNIVINGTKPNGNDFKRSMEFIKDDIDYSGHGYKIYSDKGSRFKLQGSRLTTANGMGVRTVAIDCWIEA